MQKVIKHPISGAMRDISNGWRPASHDIYHPIRSSTISAVVMAKHFASSQEIGMWKISSATISILSPSVDDASSTGSKDKHRSNSTNEISCKLISRMLILSISFSSLHSSIASESGYKKIWDLTQSSFAIPSPSRIESRSIRILLLIADRPWWYIRNNYFCWSKNDNIIGVANVGQPCG